jgi:hypothetical protein
MSAPITFNVELDLSVPDGIGINAIFIGVEIEPQQAGCIIYGRGHDGNIQGVGMHGTQSKVRLPFAHPHILVKFLDCPTKFLLSTLGWEDSRGSRFGQANSLSQHGIRYDTKKRFSHH